MGVKSGLPREPLRLRASEKRMLKYVRLVSGLRLHEKENRDTTRKAEWVHMYIYMSLYTYVHTKERRNQVVTS
jgi:hypothetical protein